MTQRDNTPPKINLARRRSDGAIRIDMESFFDFCFWIAEELQDLEAMHDPDRNRAGFGCDIPFPDDVAAEWGFPE